MAYSSGIMDKRVTILNRGEEKESAFSSSSAGYEWSAVKTIWANVTWSKGVKSMREGAFDAYDIIMVRCRFTNLLSRDSRLKLKDKIYIIQSFNADERENTIQITASELTGNSSSDY